MSLRRPDPGLPPRPLHPGPTRREVLSAAAGAALAAFLPGCAESRRRIEGRIVDASDARGHLLRGTPPTGAPTSVTETALVVVGAGVAGLSAAWKARRAGLEDLLVLDLEDRPGGTAGGGTTAGVPHPWGAHYVPCPTREQRTLCELLLEEGVVRGFDAEGRAIPVEDHLCRAPQERLFEAGQWHEGLWPRALATDEDDRQWTRFQAEVAALAARRDREGRRAFAIPLERSSRDPDLQALDAVPMSRWLLERGLTSPRLRWTVEYACRDDFGASLEETSAWAALHYHAARIAVPGDEPRPFLTWPQGNGFLVDRLARPLGDRLKTGTLVVAVEPERDRVVVRRLDLATGALHEVRARRAIVAVPRFVARRVVRGLPEVPGAAFSPWVVANLHLSEAPRSLGFPLAWDNVIAGSESLGYVVATHQSDRAARDTVLTWYRPFPGADPAASRTAIAAAPWERWRDAVLADLVPAHEDLLDVLLSIDVRRFGHGMPRPRPGFVRGEARAALARPFGPVHFAGAETAGLPLFEEAQWSGVRAAEEALAALGRPFESSL